MLVFDLGAWHFYWPNRPECTIARSPSAKLCSMNAVNPFDGLALRCPEFTVDEAGRIARELFGVAGTIKELGSNQDRNYRVDAADGRFVLKIATLLTASR